MSRVLEELRSLREPVGRTPLSTYSFARLSRIAVYIWKDHAKVRFSDCDVFFLLFQNKAPWLGKPYLDYCSPTGRICLVLCNNPWFIPSCDIKATICFNLPCANRRKLWRWISIFNYCCKFVCFIFAVPSTLYGPLLRNIQIKTMAILM